MGADKTVKEISAVFLDPSAWKRVEHGRWFHKDAIRDRLGNVSSFDGVQSCSFGVIIWL